VPVRVRLRAPIYINYMKNIKVKDWKKILLDRLESYIETLPDHTLLTSEEFDIDFIEYLGYDIDNYILPEDLD